MLGDRDDDAVPASLMMKTPMGIATKIWRSRMMSRFLALDYALTVIKPGYKPPKKAKRPAATRAAASDARSGQCLDSTHFCRS